MKEKVPPSFLRPSFARQQSSPELLLAQARRGGFKNLSPFFQVGQNVRSLYVLEAIASYLKSIPKEFQFSVKSVSPTVNFSINKKTSVSVISIVNIDTLYDYLLFFLLDMSFQTRKGVDFHFWCIVLHLHKLGYFYLQEGRNLAYLISPVYKYW